MPGIQSVQKIETISPSGIPPFGRTGQPRALKTEEIEKIVELSGIAAKNIKQAGFDMIEIHAHGGYLIAAFLSPYYNKRTDKYGGSLEGRCQFLLEVLESVKKAVGSDFPVTVKYSGEDFLPDGWDIKQSQFLAQKLEAAGADGIGVSAGAPETKMSYLPPYFYPAGCHLPFSEALKKVVKIPIFVGGRLKDPELADKAIKEGKADFIYEGRALIADPDMPNKIASGHPEEIRNCLSCSECRECIIQQRPVRCVINPVAGREGDLDVLKPAKVVKKVLVIGGGPGGMEAARIAALRGHKVTLCEKTEQLGGLMLLGGVHNEEITGYKEWCVAQMKKLPVEVKLKTEVTPALVKEIKPDVIILANGGTFVTPDIPGIDKDNVFSSKDLLNVMHGTPIKKGFLLSAISPFAKGIVSAAMVNRMLGSNFPIKSTVAVIGAQFPGSSLALLLANKGKKVTMIDESPTWGKDVEVHSLAAINRAVKEETVKILTSTKIEEITDKGVAVIDDKGNKSQVEADSVIVALDLAPAEDKLAEELKGKAKEVYVIGDSKSFQRIKNAIAEGFITSFNL